MLRAAEAHGLTPDRAGRPHERPVPGGVGPARHQPTTTSSAPPSPATPGRSRPSCRPSTTTARSTRTPTAACTACPARPTTPRTSWSTASAPSTAGRSSTSRRRTGSSGSRPSPSRLLDWYEAHPDVVAPEGKRNEALGIIRQGLEDISISRTSIDWGVPVPWDPDHVFYVWYDALINYATAIGYGDDPERFAAWWPAVHHLIGKDILRFHCVYWPAMLLAAGLEPPRQRQRPRLPARGRREDEQDRPQPDLPGRPRRRLRRRRLPLPLPARRRRSAPTATSPTRAWSPATTPTWPTTWATCWRGSPPWCSQEVRRHRAGPARRQPAGRGRGRGLSRRRRRRGRRCSRRSRSRPPGGCCARPTPTSRPTSRGRPSPDPRSTRCWATRSRCCASWPSWPPRPCPAPASRSGAASACPARRPSSACPTAAAWGGYPGGLPVEKGAPLFPRIDTRS